MRCTATQIAAAGFEDRAFDIVIIDFDGRLDPDLDLAQLQSRPPHRAFLFLELPFDVSPTPLLARLLVDFDSGTASLVKPCSADSFAGSSTFSTKASCTSSILIIFSLEHKTSPTTPIPFSALCPLTMNLSPRRKILKSKAAEEFDVSFHPRAAQMRRRRLSKRRGMKCKLGQVCFSMCSLRLNGSVQSNQLAAR